MQPETLASIRARLRAHGKGMRRILTQEALVELRYEFRRAAERSRETATERERETAQSSRRARAGRGAQENQNKPLQRLRRQRLLPSARSTGSIIRFRVKSGAAAKSCARACPARNCIEAFVGVWWRGRWGVPTASRVGVMRCMGCGAQMVLTAAVPDQTIVVREFEHQTFRCYDCAITEQKRTFTGGNPAPAQVIAPAAPAAKSEDPIEPAYPGSNEGPAAWTRAVAKLRSRQAEIRQRAEAAKRMDWNTEFNQAWEQLAPAGAPGQQNGHSTFARPKDLTAMFARSVRGRLRKTAAISLGRSRASTPIPAPSPEAAREFKQFWDSLAPGSTPPQLPAGAIRFERPIARSSAVAKIAEPGADRGAGCHECHRTRDIPVARIAGCIAAVLEPVPQKWEPVLRNGHAQTRHQGGMTMRRKVMPL